MLTLLVLALKGYLQEWNSKMALSFQHMLNASNNDYTMSSNAIHFNKSWQHDDAIIASVDFKIIGNSLNESYSYLQKTLELSKEHDAYCIRETIHKKKDKSIG